MKSLRESLLDNGLISKTDKMIKDEIEAFLKENYLGAAIKISNKPNKDGKYEVSSTTDIEVKNTNITSLTNGMFIWTVVGGSFYCNDCYSLKSLEGAPKKVKKDFYCPDCNSLKSLEGAPKEVGGDFYCSHCMSLESLEGAPKKVGETFDCSVCDSLKSLEGAPKKVGAIFHCSNCAGKFTTKDVKKVSNVKYEIMC